MKNKNLAYAINAYNSEDILMAWAHNISNTSMVNSLRAYLALGYKVEVKTIK